MSDRRYLGAFAATMLLATGGFMLMPFGSAFTVNNLGIALGEAPRHLSGDGRLSRSSPARSSVG